MNAIVVTQNCIDLGGVQDPFTCPMALALKNAGYTCYVGDDSTTAGRRVTDYDDDSKIYQHDPQVSKWIVDFDNGEKVNPFSFVLDSKTESLYMYQTDLSIDPAEVEAKLKAEYDAMPHIVAARLKREAKEKEHGNSAS